MFHRYEELFEDEGLEAVWANFFYEDVRNKRMTEAMLPLYDEFKRRFPNSPYLGGVLFGSSYLSKLSLGMEESRRFHQGQLDEAVYHIGASLKDLGKKCFGFSVLDSSYIPMILGNLTRTA